MQTYQIMKNSGVPWLGSIPADWSVVRPKAIFKDRREKSSDSDVHLTPSQKYGVLPQQDYMKISGTRVVLNLTGSDNMKHVEPGDFVIHLRSFQGGIEHSSYSGKVSNAYTILQPDKGVYHDYFKYALKSYGFISDLASTTDQLRDGQSIKFSTFDLVKLPLPDIEIQSRIADYLDVETAKIDDLIAKQERLLALLEEKRRATITRGVTQGLDPQKGLKETGIKWLPAIPEHWSVRKLGSLTRLVIGSTPSTQNSVDFNGDLVWVTIADMKSKRIATSKQMLTASAVKNKNMEMVPKGSLLFSFKLSVGKVGYADVDLYTNEAIAAFLPNDKVLSEFLYYAAQTYFVNEANTNIYGAALFNQELLKRVRVVYPEIEEQKQIANYLDEHERKAKLLRNKILTQIAILKERRASLISNVVTGKVKV